MRKLFASIVVCLLTTPLFATPDVAERLQKNTVKIECKGWSGSGIVHGRYVWTAAHVAKDAEDLKVKTLTGAVIPAKVLHICEDADLALLELTLDAKLDPVKFFTGKVRVGMPVYALGSPSGDEGIVTAGIVSKVAGTAWNQEVDQGDFAATFGSSGGPVVLQDTGEVVGIVVGGRTSSGQILFIPVRIMRAWALKIGLKDAIE